MATPKAPENLTDSSKAEWKRLCGLFSVDDDAALVLEQYFRARERLEAAETALAADGVVVKDRFGQPKPHPAAGIARDSQALMLRALKALGLPLADDPGEKPKWSGGRKPRG